MPFCSCKIEAQGSVPMCHSLDATLNGNEDPVSAIGFSLIHSSERWLDVERRRAFLLGSMACTASLKRLGF